MSTRTAEELQKKSTGKRIAYTLAAGATVAAGMADTSEAAIVYSGLADLTIAQGAAQTLRFNYDEYDDVVLKNFVFLGGNYQALTVPYFPGKVVGFNPNGGAAFYNYVTALTKGYSIDASTVGPTFYGTLSYGVNDPNAQFGNISGAFIGLAFPHGPEDLHYAWIRVDINNAAGTFVIRNWAWEDQVGVGIRAGDTGIGDFDLDGDTDGSDFLAWQRGESPTPLSASDLQQWQDNYAPSPVVTTSVPEPGTLGLLAAGAAGVMLLRKRQRRA